MSMAEGEPKHEIIIVRRGHDDHDEGHHGGVWKIAFADFMTAMMCFFLVMWLINAANEQTKSAVASYFNPVKLIDRNASRKGLEDMGDGAHSAGLAAKNPQEATEKAGQEGNSGGSSASDRQDPTDSPQKSDNSDEHLFADPYAVLSEIATDTSIMQNVSQKGDGGAQRSGPSTGASGGESYRDPFSPDFWSQQESSPGAEASAERQKIEGDLAKPGDKAAELEVPKVKARPLPKLEQAPLEPPAKDAAAAKPGEAAKPKNTEVQPKPAPEAEAKASNAATVEAAAEVKAEIAQAFKPGDKLFNGISVEATDKGVVISVTDQLDFGMFEIGSAVPRRELVLAMEKIGRIVNGQKGTIAIQGHTDARPFHSDHYDNWRLSTARAHTAYYMLVRGGVDERRITEVAGFADRKPKDPADPYAAVNRRIDILLETGG
jgi:chemotaxis protein MotB